MDDTLKALPHNNKYSSLKNTLLDKFVMKEDDKLDKLFSNLNMGHKKPSKFLQFLYANGGSFMERESILNIWCKRLPPHISLIGSRNQIS